MADNRKNLEQHIADLKAEREKREQGLDYKIPDASGRRREAEPGAKIRSAVRTEENNPFVRRLSLDELVDISRAKQNKPPVERAKPTPFISREKEQKVPELGNKQRQ